MRAFCAEQGLTFLDLTAELQSQVRSGHNVYFPDDSHWNAAGHEVAAQALARRLGAERSGRAGTEGRLEPHARHRRLGQHGEQSVQQESVLHSEQADRGAGEQRSK